MSFDDKLVKKAYSAISYTPQMVEELKNCLDPKSGPSYFIEHFVQLQHPIRGRIPFTFFDYQRELCEVYHQNRYSVAMVSRQMGKTALAAAYLLWFAMFKPDSTVLVAAHKHSGAQEIMQRIRFAYENLPDHIRAGVISYNKNSLEFDNGSRIIAQTTTPTTGRGLAISLIYADEFAYVRPSIAREFWTSISPALSTGGKCIITSTPNVDDDQFAEIWFGSQRNIDQNGLVTQVGSNGFCGYMATWEAHPERDQEWAKAEQEKISEELFRREHLCEFVSFSETLISGIKLLGLQGRDPVRTQAQVRWYEPIRDQQTYVASLDPAMGTGGDPAVIQILELPALKQVAEWRCNRTRPEQQVQVLKSILEEINQTAPNSEIYWSLENNSVGESVLVAIREIDEETIPGTFMHGKRAAGRSRKGYSTTNPTKLEACSRLKMLVESGRFLPASRILVHELKHFVAAGNTYRANTGETDDCIMALLIALRMAKDISAWDDNLSQALSSALHEQDSQDEAEPMPVIV